MSTSWLCAHMAGLTQPDQIGSHVRLVGRSELTERTNVIDGKTSTDVFPAMGAAATLLVDNDQADALPVPASVRLRSPNPEWGVHPGFMQSSVLVATGLRAIATTKFGSVCTPRLPAVSLSAHQADTRDGRYVVHIRSTTLGWRLRILARMSPDGVHDHGAMLSSARLAAKDAAASRPLGREGLDGCSARRARRRNTFFASDHTSNNTIRMRRDYSGTSGQLGMFE
jgi:hypothetical protein